MRQNSRLAFVLSLAPAFAASAVLLGSPASARASFVDGTGTLPGTACRKIGSQGTLAYTSGGSVYNSAAWGTGAMTVECPAAAAAQGTITFFDTKVTYIDNAPGGGGITCTLSLEDNDTTSFNTWTQWSTGDDNNLRTMEFSNVQGYAEGFAHFRCTLTPRDPEGNPSYLVGFRFDDDPINDSLGFSYHTFPGNMCRHVMGGSPGFTADGAISNSGTTNMTLDCPLRTTRDGGVTLAKTKIWYVDSSPGVMTCVLAAEAADSSAVSQFSQNTNVDDNQARALTFSGTKAITLFADGYAHARCIVPPPDAGGAASFVVGYALEND